MIVGSPAPASQRRSTRGTPGGYPKITALETVKVLVLAVCTGLGDAVKAPAGARWSDERAPAGLL